MAKINTGVCCALGVPTPETSKAINDQSRELIEATNAKIIKLEAVCEVYKKMYTQILKYYTKPN